MHDDAVHGSAMTMARDVSCGKTSAKQTIAANLLRLLALPKAVQELVRNGELSAGHACALVTAVDPEALARRIVAKGLSVRQAEALPQDDRTGGRSQPRGRRRVEMDADTRAAERDLAAALGMKVSIDHAAGGEAG